MFRLLGAGSMMGPLADRRVETAGPGLGPVYRTGVCLPTVTDRWAIFVGRYEPNTTGSIQVMGGTIKTDAASYVGGANGTVTYRVQAPTLGLGFPRPPVYACLVLPAPEGIYMGIGRTSSSQNWIGPQVSVLIDHEPSAFEIARLVTALAATV